VRGSIFVKPETCMGCKRCELACALAHAGSQDLYQAIHESPSPRSRVDVDRLGGFNVPLQCRHCENAQCVTVCPTGAMKRLGREGPVVVDHDLCVGCRSCTIVCHFGVPRMDESGKVLIKCDLCIERLDRGQEPACVSACPTKALCFVAAPTTERTGTFIERFAQASR